MTMAYHDLRPRTASCRPAALLRLLVAALLLWPAAARAQFDELLDEEPAAPPPAEAAAAAEPAAAAAAEPAAAAAAEPAAAAPPAAPAIDPLTIAEIGRTQPAVAAALSLPRDTPAAKLRVVLMLIDLGHPEHAALVLPELLPLPLDDAQRAALVSELGTARFMQLIRLDPPAPPEAPATPLAGLRAFAQSCLDAADRLNRDPARLASLIEQLQAPTEQQRYAARVDLQSTGDAGIIACFNALAAADSEQARAHLKAALAAMRPAVDEPLIAVLADGQPPLRRSAAEVAGQLRLGAATAWLSVVAVSSDAAAAAAARNALQQVGLPAPTPDEVQTLLRTKLAAVGSDPVNTFGEGLRGQWWSWNAEARQLAVADYSPKHLRSLAAARLCRAIAEAGGFLEPADRRRMVATGLEEAALLGRPPLPAVQAALAAMTPDELSAGLAEAARHDHIAAAAALAGELAARGDLAVLATSDGRPSPLAAALTHEAREVKFAALSAIMTLAPQRSFPGASHVAEALWYFATGSGPPTVVTAAPDMVQASTWAGELRGAGFDATPTRTGREALLAAVDRATISRLAVVVLDSDLGQPLAGEVVYQLHANPLTAGVPVLICSSVPRLAAMQRIGAHDPLVLAVPRPHGEGELASLAEQTIALTGRPFPPAEERVAQAAQALSWLAKLLAEGSPYDELRRDGLLLSRTLLAPDLSGPSLAALAALGTPESQTALVDRASDRVLPIEARRAAAAAFAASVERFGLQLGRHQALLQYERYNASETADVDTQQVLGQVLDAMERKPAAP